VKPTVCEAPDYAVFSILLLLPISGVQIFYSVLWCQIFSACSYSSI